MTKLKGYVAAALVALLLGVGLLSYRAVGQGRSATKATEARPLSDLEELRREVEILKLQVELLQKKVRDQTVEIRSIKEERRQAEGKRAEEAPDTSHRPKRNNAEQPRDSRPEPFGVPKRETAPTPPSIPAAPPSVSTGPARVEEDLPEKPAAATPAPIPPPPTDVLRTFRENRRIEGTPSLPPASAPAGAPDVPKKLGSAEDRAPAPTPASAPVGAPDVPKAPVPAQDRAPSTLDAPAGAADVPSAPGPVTAPDPGTPEQEAEAAFKALRCAPPNSAARREALKALERALKRLKRETAPPNTN